MRAYIHRTIETDEIINIIKVDDDSRFDQEYYLRVSKESFHGVLSEDEQTFTFKDHRLPEFTMETKYLTIEGWDE